MLPPLRQSPPEPVVIRALNQTVTKMVELATRCDLFGADYDAARQLGDRAYAIFGEAGMLYCYGCMALAHGQGLIRPTAPNCQFHPQDFYVAWDGIGPWRG
jgi:hypothetical protein